MKIRLNEILIKESTLYFLETHKNIKNHKELIKKARQERNKISNVEYEYIIYDLILLDIANANNKM